MPKILQISLIIILLLSPVLAGCAGSRESPDRPPRPAHHLPDGRFTNPHFDQSRRGFLAYLKMRYFSGEKYADYEENADRVPQVPPDLEQIRHPDQARLQVTWIGHATMLLQYRGINVLTDPIFSQRASPVSFAGPRRVNPPALTIEQLPPIDFVVISHNHYDHLDCVTVRRLGAGPLWLVPLGLKKWFTDRDLPADRISELDWGQNKTSGPASFTLTPAQHWSARSLWDRNQTLWGSWLVRIGGKNIWYSGDTGYNPYQFKEIGRRAGKIDLALISIGAYEPRWFMQGVHVNPAEAVKIHRQINSRYSLGIQWGTFRLTAEPIDEPPQKLRQALVEHGVSPAEFETIAIGATRVID
jgi:N-acyl-phosphatidylethanolamine-hydrolysing phospholipase D